MEQSFPTVPMIPNYGLEFSLEASIALDLLRVAAPNIVAECGKDQASPEAIIARFYQLAEALISQGFDLGYIRKASKATEEYVAECGRLKKIEAEAQFPRLNFKASGLKDSE